MAFYPSVTASITPIVVGQTLTASLATQIQDEIVAYQTEWGLEPSSTYTNTASRLSGIEQKLSFGSLTTATSVDNASDKLLIWDTSASTTVELPADQIGTEYLRMYQIGGFGTSATSIMRFQLISDDTNVGSWTVSHASTTGTEITINDDGMYAVTINYGASGASVSYGLSKNASTTTDTMGALTPTSRLIYGRNNNSPGISDIYGATSWIGHLANGDVLRHHADNMLFNGGSFAIARVG